MEPITFSVPAFPAGLVIGYLAGGVTVLALVLFAGWRAASK